MLGYVALLIYLFDLSCAFQFIKSNLAIKRTERYESLRSVGIDLGTTYSLVSVYEKDTGLRIIPVDSHNTVPSIVSILTNREERVGEPALPYLTSSPQNTYASMKRVIGKTSLQVETMKDKYFRQKLLHRDRNDAADVNVASFTCSHRKEGVTAEDIAAAVIKKLITAAELHMSKETENPTHTNEDHSVRVTRAVITVPAYFNPAQCKATERAGYMAGLEKVKLLKEPEAAAIAYGLNIQQPLIVLVFDLGGGTLDVSVLEVGNGFVEVVATNGDSYLGGDDFDSVIIEWLYEQFAAVNGINTAILSEVRGDRFVQARLREAAQEAKRKLSTEQSVTIHLPCLHQASGLGVEVQLTRRRFEALGKALIARLLQPLREVAIMAGVNLPGESGQLGTTSSDGDGDSNSDDKNIYSERGNRYGVLDEDALQKAQSVGRAVAKEKQRVRGRTVQELHRLQRSDRSSSGKSVSVGKGSSKVQLFPGGRVLDAVLLVGGATRMPCVRGAVRQLTGRTPLPQSSVHPDEAVCLGAGTMAGMLDGLVPNMQVVSHLQSAILRLLHEERNKGNDLLATLED